MSAKAPLRNRFTLEYGDPSELLAKLRIIAARHGYVLQKSDAERITVGQLSLRVGRSVATVSRSLKRPSCPPFTSTKGKRRILWIDPNERLLAYLTNPSAVGRPLKNQL